MTMDAYTPTATYTVSGTGPYAVSWPYRAGTLSLYVEMGGAMVQMDAAEFSVSPAESSTSGNITLTSTAAASRAGLRMHILRSTPSEQGWAGTAGTREKGVEEQLDILTLQLQEHGRDIARSLRTHGAAVDPFSLPDGTVLLWQDGGLVPGPTAADIADAQENAALAASVAGLVAGLTPSYFEDVAAFLAANLSAYPDNQRFNTRDEGFCFQKVAAGQHFLHPVGAVKIRIRNTTLRPGMLNLATNGLVDVSAGLATLTALGEVHLAKGETCLTTWAELAGSFSGHGIVALASPTRGYTPAFRDGPLTYPASITALWTPPIKIVRRNGRWTTNKSVRHLRPTVAGLTYHVDPAINNSAAPGATSAAGLEVAITDITQANPAVVTYSGTRDPSNNSYVWLSGIKGMVQLNNAYYRIANVNAAANTFELLDINSTGFTVYDSGGTFIEPLDGVQEAGELSDVGRIRIAPATPGTVDGLGTLDIANADGKLIIEKWNIRDGEVVLGAHPQILPGDWTEDGTNPGVWSAPASSTIRRVWSRAVSGLDGSPMELTEVRGGSEAQLRNKCGLMDAGWALVGSTLIVKPPVGGRPSLADLILGTTSSNYINFPGEVYVEGITFAAGQQALWVRDSTATGNAKFYGVGLTFLGSTDAADGNGFRAEAVQCFLEDCTGVGAVRDLFNYHALSGMACKAIEINCRGRGIGRTADKINNFSTMHDAGIIIRVRCEGGDNNGPVYADVGGSKSFNVGLRSLGSTLRDGTSGDACYYSSEGEMWLIDCEPGVSRYSIAGTTGAVLHLLNTDPKNDVLLNGGASTAVYALTP